MKWSNFGQCKIAVYLYIWTTKTKTKRKKKKNFCVQTHWRTWIGKYEKRKEKKRKRKSNELANSLMLTCIFYTYIHISLFRSRSVYFTVFILLHKWAFDAKTLQKPTHTHIQTKCMYKWYNAVCLFFSGHFTGILCGGTLCGYPNTSWFLDHVFLGNDSHCIYHPHI